MPPTPPTGESSLGEQRTVHTTLDGALVDPERARSLVLTGDELTLPDLTLPAEVGRLTRLVELSMEGFGDIALPKTLSDVVSLRSLRLEFVRGELPPVVLTLAGLERLSVTFSDAGRLPREIASLERLVDLSVEGVDELPAAITDLPRLASLTVASRNLRSLPEGIGSCTTLRHLDCSYTSLDRLPKAVCRLERLESLDISMTLIDELPIEISALKSLRELRFAKPFPHHGPESYATRVKQIRQPWGELTSLETLDLSHQQIMSVSGNVRSLTRLEELDLSYNEMDELPEELLALPSLRRVGLSFNQLRDLPAGVTSWTRLEELDLAGNPLEAFPVALFELKRLRKLDLRRVPLGPEELQMVRERLPNTQVLSND